MNILKVILAKLLQLVVKVRKIGFGKQDGPILISGSPRGGTTWVAESIARLIDSNLILWEPLQRGNPELVKFNSNRPVICDVDELDNEQSAFFKKLLNIEMVNHHTMRIRNQTHNLSNLICYRKPLIKFTRGNGVVGPISRKYELNTPLIIVRHPCAVVA